MKKAFKITALLLTAVFMLTCFSGCNDVANNDDGGIVTLSWYLPGVMDGADCAEVFALANEKLEEKYNLRVDFKFIDGGSFDQKLNGMNAAREEYDLVFTSNHTNDFLKNVNNGCLADLSELLPKYAPTVWKNTSQDVWNALTFDGAIYASPNWQEQARCTGLIIDKAKLDKVGMSIDDFKTMDDITTYLRKLHAVEPKSDHMSVDWSMLGYKYGIQPTGIGCVSVDFTKEGKPVLFNTYDTDAYEDFVKTVDSWVEEGLIRNYVDSDSHSNTTSKEIRTNAFMIAGWCPGYDEFFTNSRGYECVVNKFSDNAVLSTAGILAALTGVSETSKHKEEAVKMIEIMNTDSEILNLLCWGIEGKHYTKVGENEIELVEGSAYNCIGDYAIGTAKNAYFLKGSPADVNEQIEKFNNEAVPSPLLGCNLDTSRIESELANCQTVITGKTAELNRGLCKDVDSDLAALRKGLKDAGIDTVLAELQRQVDEWWANKK